MKSSETGTGTGTGTGTDTGSGTDTGRGTGTDPRAGTDTGTSRDTDSDSDTRDQIRGSSLLLAGRGMSVGVKFIAQLLVVRYLSTTDYGSWTYALSLVAFFQAFSSLGLNRVVGRFLPIYLEREEHGKFFGMIGLVIGGILLASATIIVAFYAFPERIAALVGESGEAQPITLLFIIIFLVPLESLDTFLTGVCATFSRSRTIFIRRYVLAPALRMVVVVSLILLQADVVLLAYGWIGSLALGIAYYAWTAVAIMRSEGLWKHFRRETLTFPVREVFGFTVPLMTSDWLGSVMASAGPLMLGYFSNMSAVALFQVVVPVAALNKIVMQSFQFLYTPSASRLHARGDVAGIARLYWRVAVWVAVLAFPVFALTYVAAEPLTVFFYGERYEASAAILSLLVVGNFFHSMIGFNGTTLKVVGKLRWLVGVNLLGCVATLLFNFLLIPSLGAVGAGIGTAAAMVTLNLLKHGALHLSVGIEVFDRHYARPYVAMGAAAIALTVVRFTAPENALLTVAAASVLSLWVFMQAREAMDIQETFPELLRFRLARFALGS